jgi:hypothetical protein
MTFGVLLRLVASSYNSAHVQGQVKKYDKEKADIKKQAEGYQKEYDALNFRDDQFDMNEACLSVAIALFGITALTKKRWLLGLASIFMFFGCCSAWRVS